MVRQLADKVQKLEATHTQDQQTHTQDQQQLEQLRKQLADTQATAAAAQQKAEALGAAPPPPVPGPQASHNFTMVGDAEVQYGQTQGQNGSFMLADFAPIFLFRARDNVLFEAGFDVTLQNNFNSDGTRAGGLSTHVDMSFGQLDYLMNDYMTFVGGYMLLPLGTYQERGAGWINKIPDDPLPRGLLPGSGAGVQLRGSLPLTQSGQHLTYAFYGVNGPSSLDIAGTGNRGSLDLGGNAGDTPNWHEGPSAGGRIGWFYPWKAHYDVELGVSGQSGTWDDKGHQLWSALVADAAVHISPYFEVKGEYIQTWVDATDGGYDQHGAWVQAAYKLAGLNLELPYLSNVELVGRYDRVSQGLGPWIERCTLGVVYYISNTLQFQGAYEFLHSNDKTQAHDQFMLRLAYGF
jgi:hypothetical protein